MADRDFEEDLRALFDAPNLDPCVPGLAADADPFAKRVQARIGQSDGLRAGLIVGLGLVGALIAWLRFGLSIHDLAASSNAIALAVAGQGDYDSPVPWASGLLVLGLGWLAVRPAFSES